MLSCTWFCQQSSWNRNSSVLPPAVRITIIYLSHGFLLNCFPWAIRSRFFFVFVFFCLCLFVYFGILGKTIWPWITIFLANMGSYGSKNFKIYSSCKLQPNVFKLLLNFLLKWFSQHYIWDFWNFENWNFNEWFSFSLTWDPMAWKC